MESLISILATVVTALIAAVVAMWKKFNADNAALGLRHDDCQQDRASMREELGKVKEDLAVFKGCQTTPCGAIDSLRRREAFDLKTAKPQP